MQTPPAQQWAIVELFGHQRIAGAISEQVFGGASMVRVDVPEIEAGERYFDRERGQWAERKVQIQAHTRSLGAAAIYSINWCDEATVRLAATAIKHRPVSEYSVVEALAALPQADRQQLVGQAQQLADTDRPF
jgi:hypothetical protein